MYCLALRSCLLGCHTTLPPKKRLLTSEQVFFDEISQSQLFLWWSVAWRPKKNGCEGDYNLRHNCWIVFALPPPHLLTKVGAV